MSPWTGKRSAVRVRRRIIWAFAPAVLALCAGLAIASEPAPPERQPLEMLAAHAAARAALLDLKIAEPPTLDDYRIAGEILATASTLLPGDQTLLRLRMEAAENAGDDQTVRRIARSLVALDPKDTVALLRVISGVISDLQTVDERLAAYDKFLGESGQGLDDSVRSRLALDAALLYRERGDMDRFAAMLTQAVELDSTNKDAATLALAFYTQRIDDPVGRFEWLLISVLKADPFDQATLAACVRELTAAGAVDGSWRFAKVLRRLADARQLDLAPAEERAYDIAEWNASSAEAVIRRLSTMVETERSRVFEVRRQLQELGQPTEGVPLPESIRLSPSRERVRVLCAAAISDTERAAIMLRELTLSTQAAMVELADSGRRPAEIDDAEADRLRATMQAELVWTRLLAGLELTEAARGLDDLVAAGKTDPETLRRFGAWRLLRSSDAGSARRALEAAIEDPLCELGLAVLAEKEGNKSEAVRRYFAVTRAIPSELAGSYARTRLKALAGRLPAPTEVAQKLDAMAAEVPTWLEEMVESPRRVIALDVEPLRPGVSPIERTPVRVTLKNISQIPLALGPDKPISSRFLFIPVIEVGPARMLGSEYVHIAGLDRRLRLLKDESVDAIIWPDLGVLSYDLEWVGSSQARIRWRVLQGFEVSSQRMFEPGPGSISAETEPLMRPAVARSNAVYDAMRRAIEVAGPRELSDTLQSLKLQIANPSSGLEFADLDRLIELLARRFASMDRATKILVMCLLPPSKKVQPCLRIDQLASQDTDEEVLAILLATRVFKADDTVFTSPTVLNSSRLSALAALVKQRIEQDRAAISTREPQVPQLMMSAPPRHTPGMGSGQGDAANPAGSPTTSGASNSGSTTSDPAIPPTDQPKQPERVLPPAVPPDHAPVPMIF